jgi:hypothetical protein
MKECLKTCRKFQVSCPVDDCRYWVDYEKDLNCVFETIDNNGALTLREAADRLGISFVRVKQIQDKAIKKFSHFLK